MKLSDYEAMIADNTPDGLPNLVLGWMDDECGLDWDSYIEWGHNVMDQVAFGDDIGTFQTFEEWKHQERGANPNDLGFSYEKCDLCKAPAGDRYAATALPSDPATNKDYCTLTICGECLLFIANGDVPDYVEGN